MKMKKMRIYFFVIMIGACDRAIYTTTIVFDKPGRYSMGSDIEAFGVNQDSISIQASNVVLELNSRSIIGGINGIVIESGVTGVVIRDGFVGYTANAGIVVKDNTSIVRIKNMSIGNCYGPAIQVLGTTEGVSNVFIEEMAITGCALSPAASSVISLNNADTVIIRDSVIDYCGNTSNTVNLIEFKNCYSSVLLNLLIAENRGASLRGVVLDNSTRCLFEQVRLIDNISDTGNFTGFLLQNSVSNSISLSKVITVSGVLGNAVGFEFADSSANKITNCEVFSLEGANAYGFYMHGSGTPSNTYRNHIGECMVMNNTATTGTACGVLITRADESCICKSLFCNNNAMSGIAAGILFQSGTGGDGWMIFENEMAHNMGMDDANSYGVNLVTGSQNLFLKNITFENGNTLANQLAGVSANSVSLTSHDLINTVSLPWTNIGVAS